MKFKTLQGRLIPVKKVNSYLIDWDSKSRSKFQFIVKQILKEYWKNHVVFEELPVVGTRYSLDLFNGNRNIAIECQGRQHTEYIPHFHNKNKVNFLYQLHKDDAKRKFCEINKIRLVEIFEDELKNLTLEQKKEKVLTIFSKYDISLL